MFSLKILDTKLFMNHLLRKNTFDFFQVCEACVKTFSTFHLDGILNHDFFSSDEKENLKDRKYSTWAEQKAFIFHLLKGNKLPLYLKFVLLFPEQKTEQLILENHLPLSMEDIHGLYFNIYFENNTVTCTCGTSLKIFTMDKTLEQVYESALKAFLKQYEIAFEEE
ncbi:MAG: DUF5721 family protein [Lachnospiraceae bacterium]